MCCGDERHGHRARDMSRHMGLDPYHIDTAHDVCGCGCGGRKFLSKRERIEMLEEYSESLKCELEGVEEELKELKGK